MMLALLLFPAQASAERQIKPFLGVTFGGGTTIVDLEHATGQPKLAIGVTGALLADVIGIEVDVARTPGFFQSGDEHLVQRSSATTVTGGIIVAAPRHLTEYTLRPYLTLGGGLMRARIDDTLGVLRVEANLPAIDAGGGATGFLTKRIGLSWDLRYFRSVGGKIGGTGLSFGPAQLSFWRASMALAIRH